MGRLLLLLIFSVILSAAILFTVTGNMLELGEVEVNARWILLVAQKAPPAEVAMDIWGASPPYWARKLAVLWDRAEPVRWWWVPLVVMAAILLITRSSRRKTRRW
jgi:hypothetical protein